MDKYISKILTKRENSKCSKSNTIGNFCAINIEGGDNMQQNHKGFCVIEGLVYRPETHFDGLIDVR